MIPVLVTTDNTKRGVFFGYIESLPEACPKRLTLTKARNVVYWSSDVHGVFGLAAKGPSALCRIGPQVPTLMLGGVVSIAVATPEAVEKWEAEPWS